MVGVGWLLVVWWGLLGGCCSVAFGLFARLVAVLWVCVGWVLVVAIW